MTEVRYVRSTAVVSTTSPWGYGHSCPFRLLASGVSHWGSVVRILYYSGCPTGAKRWAARALDAGLARRRYPALGGIR